MSLCAIIPVANMAAANASLAAQGHGSPCFSISCHTGAGSVPTHAALHAWDDPVFAARVKALPGVVWEEGDGDPQTRLKALIEAQGARWAAQAVRLPNGGMTTAGALYTWDGDTVWYCIQAFDRSVFGAAPSTYPALLRRVRTPGKAEPWVQPLDQFDAYKLVNAWTGQPDRCTFGGKTWQVSQADGSGNNVWQPGVFGWTEVAP